MRESMGRKMPYKMFVYTLICVLVFTSTVSGAQITKGGVSDKTETVLLRGERLAASKRGTKFREIPLEKQSGKKVTITDTAVIVIPKKATKAEKSAAKLLKKYIQKKDGTKVKIVSDKTKIHKGYEICIGRTMNRPHGELKGQKKGYYVIRSFNNRSISIYGVDKKGLTDGVYRFLKKFGGYKYSKSKKKWISKKKHIRVSSKTNITNCPKDVEQTEQKDPAKPEQNPQMPEGETPGGETPGSETPGGETPGSETPGSETPGSETPGGETPGGETPGGETPGGETPGGETPGSETPGSETPGSETPGGETPGSETPGSETPGGETPGSETPGSETPGGETPGSETPGSETPGSETPGGETPGGETPGSETPGSETPGNETPGSETPGGETPANGEAPRFDGDQSLYLNSEYVDEMPQAVIVIPQDATDEEELASKFLQKYIELEDGYLPAVVQDSVAMGSKGFELSVGQTNRPHGSAKYSSDGSYSIQSYEKGIAITGVGALGVFHGCMRFLEACGGYFYMSWDDILVTNQKHFRYDATGGICIDYERPFVFTDTDLCYVCLNPLYDQTDPNRNQLTWNKNYEPPLTGRLYSVAHGFNGFFADTYALPDEMPGKMTWYLSTVDGTYEEPDEVYGLAGGHAHTLLSEFVPASKYYAQHPEWYCAYNWRESIGNAGYVSDGKKTRKPNQLCLYQAANDPELYAIILQHCYDMIEAGYDPDAPMQIISLSKSDNEYLCYCDNCCKDREYYHDRNGSTESYEMLALLNKVSKDIHKDGKYENLYIDTLAYTWTLNAPRGMTADDHVIIRWAPIMRCYGHYLDSNKSVDPRNAEYYEELLEWLKVAKHVWIWDYNTNFRTTVGPFANVDVVQHDIKLYQKIGVEGVYLQSNDTHLQTNTEFGDIRNYIVGRMLQDPSRDYETELAFFTDAYYGECGKLVREYQKHMEKQMANHHMVFEHRDKFTKYDSRMREIYGDETSYSDGTHRMPDSEIEVCENLWNEINELSNELSPQIQSRLEKLEISWRLVKSTLKVYEFEDPATYQEKNDQLLADMKKTGATKFSIFGGKTLKDCLYTQRIPDLWPYAP